MVAQQAAPTLADIRPIGKEAAARLLPPPQYPLRIRSAEANRIFRGESLHGGFLVYLGDNNQPVEVIKINRPRPAIVDGWELTEYWTSAWNGWKWECTHKATAPACVKTNSQGSAAYSKKYAASPPSRAVVTIPSATACDVSLAEWEVVESHFEIKKQCWEGHNHQLQTTELGLRLGERSAVLLPSLGPGQSNRHVAYVFVSNIVRDCGFNSWLENVPYFEHLRYVP